MRGKQTRYQTVTQLPHDALTVKRYADDNSISTAHVYKLYNQNRLEIVVFQGINFVLKNSLKKD